MATLYDLLKKYVHFSGIKNIKHALRRLQIYSAEKNIETVLSNSRKGHRDRREQYRERAVLLHKHNEALIPVQFPSKALSTAQNGYVTTDKEALEVMFGIERFREYILGGKYQVRIDHKPLVILLRREKAMPSNCGARLRRWNLRLT